MRHDLLFCETHPCPSTFHSGRNALVFAPGIGRARSTTSPVSLRKQAPDPPSLFSSDCSTRSAGTRRSGNSHVNVDNHTSQRPPLPSSSHMRCNCVGLCFARPRPLAMCSPSSLLPPCCFPYKLCLRYVMEADVKPALRRTITFHCYVPCYAMLCYVLRNAMCYVFTTNDEPCS